MLKKLVTVRACLIRTDAHIRGNIMLPRCSDLPDASALSHCNVSRRLQSRNNNLHSLKSAAAAAVGLQLPSGEIRLKVVPVVYLILINKLFVLIPIIVEIN